MARHSRCLLLALETRHSLLVGLLVAGALVAGCSKDELNSLVEKGKAQVEQGVEQAKQSVAETSQKVGQQAQQASDQAQQQLQLAGDMQLQLNGPLASKGAYAHYTPPTGDRPGVLQLRSYSQVDRETFPSVLIRATATAPNAAALANQALAGQIFVQREQGGPVWCADPANPIQIKIETADDRTLVVEVVGGGLRSQPDGSMGDLTGRISAVWK